MLNNMITFILPLLPVFETQLLKSDDALKFGLKLFVESPVVGQSMMRRICVENCYGRK